MTRYGGIMESVSASTILISKLNTSIDLASFEIQ